MKTMVNETPTDLKPYGLDKPATQITFIAGSARSSLLLGSKTPEGQFYAKDASRPLVFTVEASLSDDVSKTPEDFRPKDVYEFRTFTGTRFEITRDAQTVVFEKKKEKESDPETWVQTQPPPAKAIDTSKIEDFLSKMSNLRAQSFVDALPKDAAQVARTAARWNEGKKEETVVFHRLASDAYAVRGTEPGAAKLTGSDFDDAIKALEGVK
jgi:hypothetical protein